MRLMIAVVGLLGLIASGFEARAQTLPTHAVFSEDYGDKRRTVSVRLDQRVDDAEALRLAAHIHARAKQQVQRTYINLYLAALPVAQGPWASVIYAPNASGEIEAKLQVLGLKREDEQALVAEHRADTRPLVGSWLTSPPAALGRLTIFTERGRVYGEWRLRNGQKTIDELKDVSAGANRRFEVLGGGQYAVTRAGDLELWSGTTMIALAERIRTERAPKVASGAPVLRQSLAATIEATSTALAPPLPNSAPRTSSSAAATASEKPAGRPAQEPGKQATAPVEADAATVENAPQPAQLANQLRKGKGRDRKDAGLTARRPAKPSAITNGDQISAKLLGGA